MKKINPQAISRNAEKELQQRKGSDSWLKEAISFFRRSGWIWKVQSDYQEDMVWELFENLPLANRSETRWAFFQLVACVLQNKWKAVRLPRTESKYKKNHYNNVGPVVIDIMDTLHKHGYIGMKKGYKFEDENNAAQTRVWATDKLLETCPVSPKNIVEVPYEVVILKGPKGPNGKRPLKDYRDTRFTRKTRKKLELINEVNTNADVLFLNYRIYAYVQRQFVEKWSWDGRLYTSGYRHIQGLEEEERLQLSINGDPVVEVDYSGLHPRLLYTWEGCQYDDDPYTAVHRNPYVRAFLKIILLCMINNPGKTEAEKAANDWLWQFPRKDKETGEYISPHLSYDKWFLQQKLKRIGITKAGPLIDEFSEVHEPIAHHLCTPKPTGFKLRNQDSSIAIDVLYNFAQKGIPCIPVHDSFLIQDQYKDELVKVMNTTYKKHTKGYRCPTKVKSLEANILVSNLVS
ncbi:hypothetical protein LQ318_08475 [Aliifodinibius salicampi]|uniref:DNA-directed RNA polymerase n=1 Tax=Fodinibius salicampi TaxID=1920655 RepID=A0ABT3PYL8_9BACT|nr:hypothetical protein [Fodinibius salicampi]MCW9712938.1 hypothetical protein [Fodinibius salicampi]